MISLQSALLRLGLALALGAIVGLERERGERAAGLRTHALVALGSCLVMLVSTFGFADILGTRDVVLDPSRIAAQVVSGIGFLGAGAILLRKEIIKGLTTAAAIWVVAAIGLACGAGLLLEAAITTLMTLLVLTLLQPLRQLLHRSPPTHFMRIKVTVTEEYLLEKVYSTCIEMGANIEAIEMHTGNGREKMEIECTTSEIRPLAKALIALRTLAGVEALSLNLRNPVDTHIPLSLFGEKRETAASAESM